MADSKSRVKKKGDPKERQIINCNTPNQYYHSFPSWNFSSCDKEKWSLWENAVQEIFWIEILPKKRCAGGADALKYWYGKESSYGCCIREISTLFLSDYRLCRLKCFVFLRFFFTG